MTVPVDATHLCVPGPSITRRAGVRAYMTHTALLETGEWDVRYILPQERVEAADNPLPAGAGFRAEPGEMSEEPLLPGEFRVEIRTYANVASRGGSSLTTVARAGQGSRVDGVEVMAYPAVFSLPKQDRLDRCEAGEAARAVDALLERYTSYRNRALWAACRDLFDTHRRLIDHDEIDGFYARHDACVPAVWTHLS